MALFPAEVKCPICGKSFLRWEGWVFTRNSRDYCSWSCFRKNDRRSKQQKIGEGGKRISPEERREVIELLKKGLKPTEIAERVGVTYQAIAYYKNKAEA